MINFYENKGIKKYLTKSDNPHFETTQIKVDTRILIIGSSGSGKTNLLLNYIKSSPNTFCHIHIVFKTFEPLYELLKEKLEKGISFYDDIDKLPNLEEIQKEKGDQQLVVFDDQINESKKLNEKVAEYFIRGRKKNLTMFFISQSFFKIPKIIRQQMQYLLLLKMSSGKDLRLIVSDFALGLEIDELQKIYKDATKEQFNFLKINIDEGNENKKFSKNFNEFYNIIKV
jgi:hypothetical protein